MVNYREARLSATFHALSDPTRRAMLARMAEGELTVGDLAKPFRMSLPAVSKHLRVLERAGLTEVQRHGRVKRCRLATKPMREAADWMEHYRRFWDKQFDRLAAYLENTKE